MIKEELKSEIRKRFFDVRNDGGAHIISDLDWLEEEIYNIIDETIDKANLMRELKELRRSKVGER